VIKLFTVADDLYNRFFLIAKDLPIKTYLQVASMICWLISLILIISTLGDKSPVSMLTGLGAISAVLMFTFKDSILGLVSSIQVSAYEIARIGDWITIGSKDIDGEVIDISLNIVKVRKFDKTIVSFPTQELMQQSVTNWRGMVDSGGRRIKRSIYIDANYIKFCDQKLLNDLLNKELRNPSINTQNQEILHTNLGLYREYIKSYLSTRQDIFCDGFTFLIRQLESTSEGLPLEIYAFTKTTNWVEYEEIQANIIEHLIAILPSFQLKIFQKISDNHFLNTKKL
jgi:miniconductance mechanosensitive channel